MTLLHSAFCTKENLKKIVDANRTMVWPTDLLHLNAHYGLRRDKIHILCGPTHSSKSTLAWRVAVDNAKAGAKILFWASEDAVEDVRIGMSHITNSEEILKNISIISEHDLIRERSENSAITTLYDLIIEHNFDQIYIDNLTTSMMYGDLLPSDQSRVATTINKIAMKLRKCFYIVMHTRKGITNETTKPITSTDIAGSETLPRLCQFFYIIQQFACKDKKYTTLKIAKHRGYEINKNFYILDYLNKKIVQDRAIGFDLFLDLFQKRQRLYENFNHDGNDEVLLTPYLTADELLAESEKVVPFKKIKKRVENRNLLD